jgi:hypothetical protein
VIVAVKLKHQVQSKNSYNDSFVNTGFYSERDRKKRWHQLGNAFQSVVMLKREEVRSITDSVNNYKVSGIFNILKAAISHEINSFQLRKIVDKPDKVWDISVGYQDSIEK